MCAFGLNNNFLIYTVAAEHFYEATDNGDKENSNDKIK
jgi:hypothetical protein